jgi:hypothetical protein
VAQSIKNLALGSKIQDSKGNKFIVIAKNHYASNEVTLLSEQSVAKLQMSPTPSQNTEYPNTEVAYYLNNDYLKTLDNKLQNNDCLTTSYKTFVESYKLFDAEEKMFKASLNHVNLLQDNSNLSGQALLHYQKVNNFVNENALLFVEKTSYITNSRAVPYSEIFVIP